MDRQGASRVVRHRGIFVAVQASILNARLPTMEATCVLLYVSTLLNYALCLIPLLRSTAIDTHQL